MIKQIYISAATNNMLKKEVKFYIVYFAKNYKVEKALIEAIIKQESQNNPYILRYEAHLRKADWYTRWLTDDEKEDKFAYCSMGLMQVLFATAKSLGFKGTPEELMGIKNSIAFGTLYIKKLIAKYYYLGKVISAYNQGTPRKYITGKKKGQFKNQDYVNKVLKYYYEYNGKIRD